MDEDKSQEPPDRSPGAPPPTPPFPPPSVARDPGDDAPENARPSATARAARSVDVLDPQRLLCPDEARLLRELGIAALDEMGVLGELRLLLVDDARMIEAHQRHMGLDTTTDVLTFDLGENLPPRVIDVDALLCVDEARRQSAVRAIPLVHELLLYGVHAALHCLGYDDATDADSDAMHEREDEVFEALGLAPAYRAPERDNDDATATRRETA